MERSQSEPLFEKSLGLEEGKGKLQGARSSKGASQWDPEPPSGGVFAESSLSSDGKLGVLVRPAPRSERGSPLTHRAALGQLANISVPWCGRLSLPGAM